jgi:hypothetical protein
MWFAGKEIAKHIETKIADPDETFHNDADLAQNLENMLK